MQVASPGDASPYRIDTLLPLNHFGVGCEAVLAEQQGAPRAKHAGHAFEGLNRIGNSAQRVGHQDRVDTVIIQGNLLARQADKLHRHLCRRRTLAGELPGLLGGVQTDHLLDARCMVVRQVEPGADADFQHDT